MYQIKSSWGAVIGGLAAIVAVIGTQFFGWEWGPDQLVPTIIDVVVAGIAVLLVASSVRA